MAIIELGGHIFVPRSDWGARYSAGRTTMPAKVKEINVHHTASNATDNPCVDMLTVERVLHERGLAPGYSYVIHPSGVILEGAGGMVGAHTAGRNKLSYGIAFIGNFENVTPTAEALNAAAGLVNLLRFFQVLEVDLAKVDIKLHRDTSATLCPGRNLVNMVGLDGRPATVAKWMRFIAGSA